MLIGVKEIGAVALVGLLLGLVVNALVVGNAVVFTSLDPLFISGFIAVPLLILSRALMRAD